MYSLLKGLRVLDFTRLIPGAYATAKLADLGADVIKVEQPPTGDYLRSIPPLMDGLGVLHLALNRNKRSVAIDLKTDDGRSQFEKLLKTADVFIEGGRPGAAARSGVDYDTLRQTKPDIIYCSLSGYGQDGPYAHLPSHGGNLEAAAGFVKIQPREDGTAGVPNIRVFMASQSGGTHAALAICAAMYKRNSTGEGSYLDVGCWDGAVSWQYGNLTCLANTGELFPGSEGMGPKYGCYKTSDGRWILIALIEPKFWKKFCEGATRPDLAGEVDESLSSDFGSNEGDLRKKISELMETRSQAEWVEFAVQHQLPLAPVLDTAELLDNEHMKVRGLMASAPHPTNGEPFHIVATPVKVLGEEYEVTHSAPQIGQHNDEVLGAL